MASFMSDKLAPFQRILSAITGHSPEWIDVNATAAAAGTRRRALMQAGGAPIQLRTQVHAPADQVAGVKANLQGAVADGTLASQLNAIGLTLVPDSGGWQWVGGWGRRGMALGDGLLAGLLCALADAATDLHCPSSALTL